MTAKDRHDELVAPIDHRAEAERLLSEADGNVPMTTTIGLGTVANTHALLAMLDLLDSRLPEPRKVDPDLAARNLEALKHAVSKPMAEHGECCEPAPADDLPGEPVEPGDLRAGDRVAFTWSGKRITCTLVSVREGAILRSDTPDKDDYYPNVVVQGKWCSAISDVRLIERAPREDEDPDEALAKVAFAEYMLSPSWDEAEPDMRKAWLDVARAAREHIEAEVLRKVERATDDRYDQVLDRANKAEAKAVDYEGRYECSHATNMAAQSALVRAEAERDALRERLDALRADVVQEERTRHYGPLSAILDRDDERRLVGPWEPTP